MTFQLINFAPAHARALQNYAGQETVFGSATDSDLEALAHVGPAWSGLWNGELIGCAGFIRANRWRAQVWALFQRTNNPRSFVAIHKCVLNKFRGCEFRRIETFTNPRHVAANRWVKLLGFTVMVPYRPLFFPDGSGATEWSLDVETLRRAHDADQPERERGDDHSRVREGQDLRTHEGEVRGGARQKTGDSGGAEREASPQEA